MYGMWAVYHTKAVHLIEHIMRLNDEMYGLRKGLGKGLGKGLAVFTKNSIEGPFIIYWERWIK